MIQPPENMEDIPDEILDRIIREGWSPPVRPTRGRVEGRIVRRAPLDISKLPLTTIGTQRNWNETEEQFEERKALMKEEKEKAKAEAAAKRKAAKAAVPEGPSDAQE